MRIVALCLLLACRSQSTPVATDGLGPATVPTGPPGAQEQLADRVILGRIYTVDPRSSHAQALGMRDGMLVYIGDLAGAVAWIGPATDVVRLQPGQTVLPGLHDAHVHLLEAFHPAIRCIVRPASPTKMASQIANCSVSEGTEWVLGWGYYLDDLAFAGRAPRAYLDDDFPTTPVAIMERTSHSTWVNTEALRRLGIDDTTPDPSGGLISHFQGQPDGLLLDSAGELPFDLALEVNPVLAAQNLTALRRGLAAANRNGLTSVGDARVYWKRGYLDAWKQLRDQGELSVRASLGLWAYPTLDTDTLIRELSARYSDEPGALLRVDQVKLYSDGLISNTTAALLEPYSSATWGPPTGLNVFDQARLTTMARALTPVGFDLHIHTIGDRAVHEALNAIEASAGVSTRPPRHRLTHVELVAPDDVPRFAQLGVIADLQISRWTLPARLHDNDPYLGAARVDERSWPLRDLYDSGATVVLSSDYDVGELSPFAGMARAIDRGEQSLPSVDAALRATTISPAFLLRQEDRTGSIELGKLADLIVVDRDPFTTDDLASTEVLCTLLGGKEVYRSADF